VLSKWIPYGDVGGFAKQLPDLLRDDWTNTMTVLRDAGFQNALDDYPRVPRSFVIAHGVEDTVVSTYHFRTADGREMKPEDYIMAFERFVRENPEHIEALNLLLRRPRSFNTNVLSQLRKKLAERPEKYTEENLRRAYQKELADIISIIKHAVTGEPLITAQERVDRAMSDVMEGKTFTLEQEKWLQLIRDHLARNLLVEKDHFSTIPFSRYGGWKRADSDFEGKLEELILNINEAVLA
jgi:type I restriction enzyme R subunit